MMRRHLRMTIAIVLCLTAMIVETTLVYADGAFVIKGVAVVLAVSLVGFGCRMLLRSWQRFALGVWFLQAVVGVGLTVLLYGAVLAQGIGYTRDEAWRAIRDSVAPVHGAPALGCVLVLSFVTLNLLIDLCVFATREAGLTIIPIATWYTMVASVPNVNAPFHAVVVAALGFCGILLAEAFNRVDSWPRHVKAASNQTSDTRSTLWNISALLALPCIALTLALAPLVPLFPSSEQTKGPQQILRDPRLDLRQNLRDDTPVKELARYSTKTSAGSTAGTYLRMATLPKFTGNGWAQSTLDALALPQTNFDLSAVPGLLAEAGPTRTTEIYTRDLGGGYLPLPYAPRKVTSIPKQWSYDPSSMVVHATDGGDSNAASNLHFTAETLDISPTGASLLQAAPGTPAEESNEVPAELDPRVRELTSKITASSRTPLEKASALQEYLRSSEFTYDLNSGPKTTGTRAVADFLLTEKRGYCEQFAGAMGVMARIAGFHSRVVIGFLPGRDTGAGTYSVSNKNMHAWTELFFDQWGWVRFEPTPGSVTGSPPEYTTKIEVAPAQPTPSPSARPSAESPTPTALPSATERSSAAPVLTDGSGLSPWLLGICGAVVLVGLLMAAPGLVRQAVRRRRLSAHDDAVPMAWQELRAQAKDLSIPWPLETPRMIANSLVARLSPGAARHFAELAASVERHRFARHPGQTPADLTGKVEAIRQEWLQAATRKERVRAALWPTSLWSRPSRSDGPPS